MKTTKLLKAICIGLAAFFIGNASAITGAYDAGGGLAIPLPPGEWRLLSDKPSPDYSTGARAVVLGHFAGNSGGVVGISIRYSRSSSSQIFSYPICYRNDDLGVANFYGTIASSLVNKCSGVWSLGAALSPVDLLVSIKTDRAFAQRYRLHTHLTMQAYGYWKDVEEGFRKLPDEPLLAAEVTVRSPRRAVDLMIFIRPPRLAEGKPISFAQQVAMSDSPPAVVGLSKWLASYVESLERAISDQTPAPELIALDFGGTSTQVSSAQRRYEELMEEINTPQDIVLGYRQREQAASAKALIAQERQARLDAEKGEQESAKQLLEQQAELVMLREKLAAQNSLEKERVVTAEVAAEQRAARDKAERERLAALKLLEEERRSAEELAEAQRAAQDTAEREMAEQQLLEQERRVAEQKAQAARLLAKEAELAQVREQLAKAKQQAAAVSNGPVTSAPKTQLSSVTSPNANRRKALVFGNDKYLSVSPLQNAVADGEAMAAKLQALGYAVTSSYNVSRKEMLSAVRNFSGRVQGGDEVIFFYAGHGVELEGRNYLLPIDIHGDDSRQVRDDAIELQRILTDMSDSRAKFTLAVVDACRDNPFVSAGRAIGGRGLAPTTAATGQMVIFSAGAGQQALDRLDANDKSPNGLFTRIFMEEMSEPNVPIDRVVKKVRQKVFQAAQTVGHEQVPAIYDQVVGDFFFVKK